MRMRKEQPPALNLLKQLIPCSITIQLKIQLYDVKYMILHHFKTIYMTSSHMTSSAAEMKSEEHIEDNINTQKSPEEGHVAETGW